MMLGKEKLKGVLPAIVTPTDNDGKIKKPVTRKLLRYLMGAGGGGSASWQHRRVLSPFSHG